MGKRSTIIGLFVAVVLFTFSQAQACLCLDPLCLDPLCLDPLCLDPSFPDTVTIELEGYGAVGMAELWGGGLDGANRHAGVYMLDKTAGAGEGELWDNGYIGAFCIELSQFSPGYPRTYDVVMPEDAQEPTPLPLGIAARLVNSIPPPNRSNVLPSLLLPLAPGEGGKIGSEKAGYLSELWGRFFDTTWVTSESFTEEQNIAAEAFAVAVWEIVYEDVPASAMMWDVAVDGTAGPLGFRCENVDISLANGMLRSLDGTGPKAELRAFVNGCKQDYLVEVPEPATILLLGLSSLTLIRGKRK